MKVVNIAELKNRLSHYLRIVRRGEALIVRDRDRPVARIEPVADAAAADTDSAVRIADLEARGVVRRGQGGLSPALFAGRPHVQADVVEALLSERRTGP